MSNTTSMEKRPETGAAVREQTRPGWVFKPNVDILETPEELLLIADVPGADPQALDIRLEEGVLTVRAPVKARQPENLRYLLREYEIGDFVRTFEVGESLDAGKISAEYHDGVLRLHLPKTEAAKPRKIQVKVT